MLWDERKSISTGPNLNSTNNGRNVPQDGGKIALLLWHGIRKMKLLLLPNRAAVYKWLGIKRQPVG